MNGTIFLVSAPCGLGEGPKGQISLNLNYRQFQRFLNQTLCVFSQMKDIKHIRCKFSFGPLSHALGLGTWGAGGQIFSFLNMVMWHIKLKGMGSRPGYTEYLTL